MSASVFTATAGFLRGVGNQAAISVAASGLAAVLLAVSGGVSLPFMNPAAEPGDVAKVSASGWVSPVAPDGKVRMRHQDAAGSDAALPARDGQGLFSPAAIVMPMALEWSRPVGAIAAVPEERPAVAGEARARAIQAQALPPRRPALDRAAVPSEATPLQIAPAVAQVAANDPPADITAGPAQRRVLGMTMPTPVSRVGDAVSGAVGLVGAAGIWTLSRASDLLPRL